MLPPGGYNLVYHKDILKNIKNTNLRIVVRLTVFGMTDAGEIVADVNFPFLLENNREGKEDDLKRRHYLAALEIHDLYYKAVFECENVQNNAVLAEYY